MMDIDDGLYVLRETLLKKSSGYIERAGKADDSDDASTHNSYYQGRASAFREAAVMASNLQRDYWKNSRI